MSKLINLIAKVKGNKFIAIIMLLSSFSMGFLTLINVKGITFIKQIDNVKLILFSLGLSGIIYVLSIFFAIKVGNYSNLEGVEEKELTKEDESNIFIILGSAFGIIVLSIVNILSLFYDIKLEFFTYLPAILFIFFMLVDSEKNNEHKGRNYISIKENDENVEYIEVPKDKIVKVVLEEKNK